MQMLKWWCPTVIASAAVALSAAVPDTRSTIAERVRKLTRDWKRA